MPNFLPVRRHQHYYINFLTLPCCVFRDWRWQVDGERKSRVFVESKDVSLLDSCYFSVMTLKVKHKKWHDTVPFSKLFVIQRTFIFSRHFPRVPEQIYDMICTVNSFCHHNKPYAEVCVIDIFHKTFKVISF